MRKQVLIITAILLITGSAAAVSVSPTDWNITAKPDTSHSKEFDIEFNDNQSVDIDTDVDWMFFDTTHFESSPATFKATVLGKDPGNYTATITANNSDHVTVQYHVRSPYKDVFKGWVNKSETLQIGQQKWRILDITSKLHLERDNTSITIEDQQQVNGLRIKVLDSIPGQFVKIDADTKTGQTLDITFEKQEEEKDTQCQVQLQPINGITSLRRGQVFSFEVKNAANNQFMSDVVVKFTNKLGQTIGKTQTGLAGGGSILVPEDLGLKPEQINEDQRQRVDITAVKPNSNCIPYRQSWQTKEKWTDFIDEKDQFQLTLELNKSEIVENVDPITGEVGVKEGDRNVETGIIEIKQPDEGETDTSFSESTFEFTPEQTGEYEVRATKQGFQNSEWNTVTVLKDGDGDGVPDTKDKCQDEPGEKETDGCKPASFDIKFYENGEEVDTILGGRTYTVRAVSDDGENTTFDDDIQLETDSEGVEAEEIDFENGTATWTPTGGITYRAKYNGSTQYSSKEQSITTEEPSMNPYKVGALSVIALLFLAAVGIFAKKKFGSDASTTMREKSESSMKFANSPPPNQGTEPEPREEDREW